MGLVFYSCDVYRMEMKTYRLSHEEKLKIRAEYDAGLSGSQLSRKFDRNLSTVFDLLRKTGGCRSDAEGARLAKEQGRGSMPPSGLKYTRDKDFFEAWSPEMSWVLGLTFGDGNVKNNRFKISCGIDKDIAEKVASLINYNGPLRLDGKCWIIEVVCAKLVSDLFGYGVFPSKTYTMKFPEHVPSGMGSHMVRGLFESDGCVCIGKTGKSKGKMSLHYVSVSMDFVVGLRDFIHRETQINTVVHVSNCSTNRWGRAPLYSVSFTGKKAKMLASWLYANADPSMSCDRKRQLVYSSMGGDL